MNKYDFGEVKKGSYNFDSKYYQSRVMCLNQMEGDLHFKDGVHCDRCRNKGVIYYKTDNDNIECYFCECVDSRKVKTNVRRSGLAKQMEEYSFDNFNVSEEHSLGLKLKAEEYVKEIISGSNKWWYLMGQVGSGKTHITTAIMNNLAQSGKTFQYMRYASDMPKLQRGLRNFNVDIKSEAELEMHRLKTVKILYIDDFLKTKDTQFLFEIIDYRYAENLTTLITTELSYVEQVAIDEATASRIYERAGGYVIEISKDQSKNYRMGG